MEAQSHAVLRLDRKVRVQTHPGVLLICLFVTITSVMLFVSSMAHASIDDLMEACGDPYLGADVRIEACDQVTNQAGATPEEIAAARRLRGFAYLDQKRYDTARIEFRHAPLFDPDDEDAQTGCTAAIVGLGHDEDGASRAAEHGCALVSGQTPSDPATRSARDSFNLEQLLCGGACPDLNLDALAVVYLPEANPDVNILLAGAKAHRAAGNIDAAAAAYGLAGLGDPMAVHCGLRGEQYESAYILRLFDQSVRPNAYGEALVPRAFDVLGALLDVEPRNTDALRERALLYMVVKA